MKGKWAKGFPSGDLALILVHGFSRDYGCFLAFGPSFGLFAVFVLLSSLVLFCWSAARVF